FAETSELKEANMKVYCNEYVPYGLQTNVVITMENLPVKSAITIHLSTPSYLLAFFEIGNVPKEMPPKFRRTSSISRELSILKLLGRTKSSSRIFEIREIVPVKVNLPQRCHPHLTMPKCSDAQSPRQVLITRGLFINALFLDTCNLTIRTTYTWTLKDAGMLDGFYFSSRCYIKLIMGQVEAVIIGGKTRSASRSETLWMDGSTSYDFSKRNKEVQFSSYNWNCYSLEDSRNPFCHQNISSVAVFSIPANSLKAGCIYIFRLKVTRDEDPSISSQKEQVITIVNDNMLQVTIECVRNCRGDFFIPNSKVHLEARCTNCGSQILIYKWYVDGQFILTNKELILDKRTSSNEMRVKVLISSADGRYGWHGKILAKNPGPTGGTCSVNPKEGHEALTPFYPCCRNFVSSNSPIEYWYYAGPVLLNNCLDCNCEVYLPVTNFIKVLVCDVFWSCHTTWIKVKVAALKNIPHNIPHLLNEGPLHRYLQVIQSAASHLTKAESGIILLRNFTAIQPQSLNSLARLANLTLTLAQRLYLVDQKSKVLITMVVHKMDNNLREIYLDHNVSFLKEKPLVNIYRACLEIYEIMKRLYKSTYRPPWLTYHQNHDLNETVISDLQTLGSEITIFPWIALMNSTSEKDRLNSHFSFPKREIHEANLPGKKDVVIVTIHCFDTFPKSLTKIKSGDQNHVVYFTPAVIKEVLGKTSGRVCLKVVSTEQNLHWWYPAEKRPCALVVSVRIFEKVDQFTAQIPLINSHITFKTMALGPIQRRSSKFRATDGDTITHAGLYVNAMKEGTLHTFQDVRMYRVVLKQHTLLAVHFTRNTHELQVILKIRYKPLFREISASKCRVHGHKHKTLLLRNNCHKKRRAYMALRIASNTSIRHSANTPIADGPASFTFTFQIRSCDTWAYNYPGTEQRWLQHGCYPTMDLSVKRGARCQCSVLGTYTNYLYYIPPHQVPVGAYREAHINIYVVVFYSVTLSIILLLIVCLYIYRNSLHNKTILYPNFETEDKSKGELHDFVITLKTGGRLNAGTTASVKLALYSTLGTKRKITVFQDPGHIFIKQNTSIYLWIRTRDIRIPTEVVVYHNNAGRFPSWFLRRIEVNDMQTRESQVFMVQTWVKEDRFLLTSSLIYRPGDVRFLDSWKTRFRTHFEMLWINWSMWQPVSGGWRESAHYQHMTRAKRFCVFISKLVITLTCSAVYFGLTTTQTLQLRRTTFMNYKDLAILAIFSLFIDVVVQIVFDLTSWKCG
ncbi:hypothetical protein M5D96_008298, partial [Drosophila gunungcola]